MTRRRRLPGLAFGSLMRQRSARVRLTALYCCLFFPSGAVLVVIAYTLLSLAQNPAPVRLTPHGSGTSDQVGVRTVTVAHLLSFHLPEFFVVACIVLLAMTGLSVLLGWLAAGRVLRPLRVMTTTTRQISERNLHERLALAGPPPHRQEGAAH